MSSIPQPQKISELKKLKKHGIVTRGGFLVLPESYTVTETSTGTYPYPGSETRYKVKSRNFHFIVTKYISMDESGVMYTF